MLIRRCELRTASLRDDNNNWLTSRTRAHNPIEADWSPPEGVAKSCSASRAHPFQIDCASCAARAHLPDTVQVGPVSQTASVINADAMSPSSSSSSFELTFLPPFCFHTLFLLNVD